MNTFFSGFSNEKPNFNSHSSNVEHELNTRFEQDLEEKRQRLTDRVLEVLYLHRELPQKDFQRKQCERIVYEHQDIVEEIFKSTVDFYAAADIYKDRSEETKTQYNLKDDYTIQDNIVIKDNLKMFHMSIESQKNIGKSNIAKLNARSHEFDMLLPLEGLEFLKSKDINDFEDLLDTKQEIANKLLKARIYGALAKLETNLVINKQKLIETISDIFDKPATRETGEVS